MLPKQQRNYHEDGICDAKKEIILTFINTLRYIATWKPSSSNAKNKHKKQP
jgi:hypothetical protein